MSNVPKQAEAKRDGVINPQNYNFKQFDDEKFLMLSNATNQPKSTVYISRGFAMRKRGCVKFVL